jgi:acyl-CoA synthetase (AMP-forming)/AMP-acid ligase II
MTDATTDAGPTTGASPTTDPMRRAVLGDQLRRHAQQRPDAVAVVFYHPHEGRTTTTYGELDERADQIAAGLAARGVGKGDVVAMMSRNSPDYMATWYAALRLGAPFTGVNFTFKPPEISYQIGHAEAKVLVVEDAFADKVAAMRDDLDTVETFVVSRIGDAEIPDDFERLDAFDAGTPPDVDLDENDVAMLQYTSGTEAFPKAVMITHRNYLIGTLPAWQATIGIKPSDCWLFLMPFHTIAGLGTMTNLTQLGATLVLVHAIDPPSALRMMEDEGVTIMAQTPAFFVQMAQVDGFADADLSRLERCITYGGTMPGSMIGAWRDAVPDLLWGTYYGQSELSQLGSVGWFRDVKDLPGQDPTWIGKLMPQLEARIVDIEGVDGEVGELICRSPAIMLGYHKDPEKTAEVFRGGWLHTGDIVRRDAEGNLFFYDRSKDMIKTGGMNVSSQEVERVLFEHEDVLECAVIGQPDDYWSERVTGYVVLRDGASITSEALVAHCKEQMAGYKVPKDVHVVDALPRDTQGKLLKRELRTGRQA